MYFSVNKNEKSRDEYKEFLYKTLNLPIHSAESIFFWQGRLEASPFIKGGTILTSFLEKVSGSYGFKTEYDSVAETNNTTEKSVFELSKEMFDIRKQKKTLQKMEEKMDESGDLHKEREAIIEKIDILEVEAYTRDIDSKLESLTEYEQSIDQSVENK